MHRRGQRSQDACLQKPAPALVIVIGCGGVHGGYLTGEDGADGLWAYQRTLEEQGVADYVLRREVKERKAVADAELEQLRVKEWRAYEQCKPSSANKNATARSNVRSCVP